MAYVNKVIIILSENTPSILNKLKPILEDYGSLSELTETVWLVDSYRFDSITHRVTCQIDQSIFCIMLLFNGEYSILSNRDSNNLAEEYWLNHLREMKERHLAEANPISFFRSEKFY